MNKKWKKHIKFIIIIIYILLWVLLVFWMVDYLKVKSYKEPIFCIEVNNNINLENWKKCKWIWYNILYRNSNRKIKEISYYKFYVLWYEFSNWYNWFSQKTIIRNIINFKTILILLFVIISGVYLYINNKKPQD